MCVRALIPQNCHSTSRLVPALQKQSTGTGKSETEKRDTREWYTSTQNQAPQSAPVDAETRYYEGARV